MLTNHKFSSNTLILIETAVQTEWLAAQATKPGVVIAITPEAAYACQKQGLSYQKIEDYAQVTKRLSEYTPILQNYLEWEAWLDQWAQQAIPEFGAAGFRPAYSATFLLQFLFTEIWSDSLSLQELLEAIQPTQVALWPPQITYVPVDLQPLVSPLTTLAPPIVRKCGFDLLDLSEQAPQLTPVTQTFATPLGFKQLVSWAKGELRQKSFITDLVQAGLTALESYVKRSKKGSPHILFSGYTYDLSPLARALRQRGARVTVLPDKLAPPLMASSSHSGSLITRLATAGERLLQEPELWKPLEQWKIDRTPLWSKPIYTWWHQLVPELWRHFQRTRQLLSRHKSVALVTWDSGGNTLSGGATNAAKVAGIPCYIYQHGSSSSLEAQNAQMYLRCSDTFLVYGQSTVNDLEQSCPSFLQPHSHIVPVGSSRLDMLRQRHWSEQARRLRAQLQAGDNRPLILYVPTCFALYGRAVGDLAAYPEVSYFELQQAVLKLWRDIPNTRLLYKEFIPAFDPNRVMGDFIRAHIPDAIVTNQRLTDLMWAVDAIVVDHVITAIGEVLLTNKPLVVYMPQLNICNPEAKTLLQKRATVAETPTEFIVQVKTLLQAGAYPELTDPNQEFLQAYCTHLGDGRSAQRAASLILQNG